MSVTIAASSSTHFLWNGNPLPRVYRVVPDGALDARLDSVEDGSWLSVQLGSTVAGSVPATRDALVAALAGIVSPSASGGGGAGGTVTVDGPVTIGGTVATASVAYGADTSATITAGGTAQQVLAASAQPRDIFLTNDSGGDLRVMFGVGNPSATVGRVVIPGGSIENRTAERMAIWGATTGQAFTYSIGVA